MVQHTKFPSVSAKKRNLTLFETSSGIVPGRFETLAVSKRPNYLLGRFETFLGFEMPGQFKTWFQNGQINNLAVLNPHLISKFFYSMCLT